jgi:hypothetical protein
MTGHRTENARTLASLLGINTDEASQRLDVSIAVITDPTDVAATVVARYVDALLARTVADVHLNTVSPKAAAEVVIGAVAASRADAVRVHVSNSAIRVGRPATPARLGAETHPILLLLAACYASGAVLKAMFGARLQVPGAATPVDLDIPTTVFLGQDASWLSREFELTDTYLAGAGAIGNGFLMGLSLLRVSGSLHLVDPDTVSVENLNRCVWFTAADVGLPKAVRLSELAQSGCPRLKLIPHVMTVQQLGKKIATDTWLNRLVVGVDSRRTRRHLQNEIPREVFDASTTGAVECVLHHHVQPTASACLACIYHETVDELARERHMAETLGVEMDDIVRHFVAEDAARRIHAKYPHVPVEQLEGQAYDTLFKALCSEGTLTSAQNRQVLAPFAFISTLAGALLAIEVGRRLVLGPEAHDFNYWRISPWAQPVADLKDKRGRRRNCDFCGQTALLQTAQGLWGSWAHRGE